MTLDTYDVIKQAVENALDVDGYRYISGQYVLKIDRGHIAFIDPIQESESIKSIKNQYEVLRERLVKVVRRTLEKTENAYHYLEQMDIDKLQEDNGPYFALLHDLYEMKNELDDELNVFTDSRS